MVSVKLTGGLANILFQVSACINYSLKHGMNYVIPTTTTNIRWKHYRFENIKYGDVDTIGFFHHQHPDIRYNERPYDIRFHEIPYHENVLLEGHFLSHKYFQEHEEKILSLFNFKWKYRPATMAVHTRVGDYKNMPKHLPVLPLSYYQRAIELAFDKTGINEILVFGDDTEHNIKYFTEENFPYLQKINFSVDNNEIEDLEAMSGCPVIVTSNSTYSLWATYVNRHRYKMTICPKQWYGPAYGEVNKTDMYPTNSIIL